ncbi:DUF6702 family protein [Winogradskyella sp.]|jgi:hypothetical protein|uniref:DUF6702 family protein n=1 Tax=Winogradskyella sp. TaxID=1883156 RepID=UPI0025CD69B1|nr:DUF6702 family protein [Winogradskyella sp.]MCT4629500.1 peptidase E [Winogradskyella sp.]
MKPLYFIFTLLFSISLISSDAKHDYYVSVTNIEYSKEQQSIQIINQVFIDDFEKLIRERYDESITLTENEEQEVVELYMQRYLSQKLKIKINGTNYNFNYIGKEYKDDITYSYLEIENIKNISSISVTNQILFDILPEQQNIVRLKLLGKNKSFLLNPDNDECLLNFN